jgi:hypothetical protein
MVLVLFAGCGNGDNDRNDAPARSSDSGSEAPATSTDAAADEPAMVKDSRYGTVEELKEAAVAAGYLCKRWVQDDKVQLAAESGHCSGADVFATFASQGELQAQLETRQLNEMFAEADVEDDTLTLVGPNWPINGHQSVEVQAMLGGTVTRQPGSRSSEAPRRVGLLKCGLAAM